MAKQGLTLDALRDAVVRKEFATVYLFHGEETLLAEEATRLIIEGALSPDERVFNLDVLYGNETTVSDILARATSYPMMAERRIVVVRNMDRLPMLERDKELLSHYIGHPSATTMLILVAQSPDLRKKPYPSLRKSAVVLDCKPLYDNQVPAWILSRVREQGKDIAADAAQLLGASVNPSLREIQNELEKLYIYSGERRSITTDDVSAVVGVSRDFNVFALQKTIGVRDLSGATLILERMIDAGEQPTLIIFMLSRYFVTLWKLLELKRGGASPQELARDLKINPYFLREYHEALQHYSKEEIEQVFVTLALADEKIKTTSLKPKQVMHVMLVGIAGSREELAVL
jgi:DNA polymerase III subunit delta